MSGIVAVLRVSLSELAGGAGLPPLLDDLGRPVEPMLVVDLDAPADPALLRAARDAAAGTDRILVGVRTRTPPDEEWDGLLAALDMTLVQVASRGAPVSEVPAGPPQASAPGETSAPGEAVAGREASSSRAEVARAEVVRAGAARAEVARAGAARAGAGQAEIGRAGAGQAEMGRAGVGLSGGEPAGALREMPVFCVAVDDPVARAGELHAAVTACPQAATVLAQVLRASAELDVRRALDVESFAYSTLLGGSEFRRWLAARGPRPLPPPARVPPVLVERAGGHLLITLNRPERRNAYGREVRDALVDALRVAVLDPGIGRVTVSGAGPVFCAGGDLDEFGTAPDTAIAHFVRTRGGAGELLHRIAHRAEVRLQGACVGAGIELAAFAGRVVAAAGTTVRLPEVGMGLIPGAGGTVGIPRRIGRWRTCYLALSGARLDAATALRWGLVDALAAEAL